MKTKIELDQNIAQIITLIYEKYPELSKYITEMPVNNSENDEISIKNLEVYYLSLEDLVKKYAQMHEGSILSNEKSANEFPGYPSYAPADDIYNKSKKELDLNPENPSKQKTPNEIPDKRNEKGFNDDVSGRDLDVPGAELDDEQEDIGNEDEENNFYSLGGDRHNNLDEN